ncbi:MAG: threonine/serine exporter family protein [Eubacteriaceae bacterium]
MEMIMTFFYAFFASFAFAITFNIRKKRLFFAAFGGALGWIIFNLFNGVFQNDVYQYFFATIGISLYAEMLARISKAPTTIYLAVALIPLVPGGGVYYTMLHLLNEDVQLGVSTGLHTLAIAGSLAMGILLVSTIVTIVRKVFLDLKQKKLKQKHV